MPPASVPNAAPPVTRYVDGVLGRPTFVRSRSLWIRQSKIRNRNCRRTTAPVPMLLPNPLIVGGLVMSTPECIFCKIAAGEIPSQKVFDSDAAMAFLDTSPLAE